MPAKVDRQNFPLLLIDKESWLIKCGGDDMKMKIQTPMFF
jgi:hypothetical protein